MGDKLQAALAQPGHEIGVFGGRGVDDQAVSEQDGMAPLIVDDLEDPGSTAEEDDLNDVGEGEILESTEKTHVVRL